MNNIRKLREYKGISAEAIANELGVSQSVIVRLENEGKKLVHSELLKKVAKVLNVNENLLFTEYNLDFVLLDAKADAKQLIKIYSNDELSSISNEIKSNISNKNALLECLIRLKEKTHLEMSFIDELIYDYNFGIDYVYAFLKSLN